MWPIISSAKGDYQVALKTSDDGTQLEFSLCAEDDGNYSWPAIFWDLPEDWAEKWHQIAATYDGKVMKLYVDGEEVGSKEGSYQVPNWDGIDALGIGYDSKNPDHTLRGQMSLARIYARALTTGRNRGAAQYGRPHPAKQRGRTRLGGLFATI